MGGGGLRVVKLHPYILCSTLFFDPQGGAPVRHFLGLNFACHPHKLANVASAIMTSVFVIIMGWFLFPPPKETSIEMLCFGKSGQKSLFQIKDLKKITSLGKMQSAKRHKTSVFFFFFIVSGEMRIDPLLFLGGVVIFFFFFFFFFFCPQPNCPLQTLVRGAFNILVWVCSTFLSNLFLSGSDPWSSPFRFGSVFEWCGASWSLQPKARHKFCKVCARV